MKMNNNDNHSAQLNPNNDAYWQSHGWESRPDDWEERVQASHVSHASHDIYNGDMTLDEAYDLLTHIGVPFDEYGDPLGM